MQINIKKKVLPELLDSSRLEVFCVRSLGRFPQLSLYSREVTNSHIDQIPVGLTSQSVERCTNNRRAVGSNLLRRRMNTILQDFSVTLAGVPFTTT